MGKRDYYEILGVDRNADGSAIKKAYRSLEYIFHPRSVAVVGAFSDPCFYPAYVHWLQVAGYGGSIYPVNPSFDELLGLPAYPSIRDVPGPIDYVISCLPDTVGFG